VREESERVAVVLRSIPQALLRATYLRDYIGDGSDANAARILDALCARGARAESTAREPMMAVVMLLAGLGDDPVLDTLGRHAAELHLPHLGRLLRRAPVTDQEAPPARVPDYGSGQELSVGERKALARKPSRALFDKLLQDPHPLVIRQLLENPRLTEDDLVRVAARRPGNVEALRAIAQTEWLCRPRVRMALIHNPATPSFIAVPLVAACTRPELTEIRGSTECCFAVREIADELLGLRSLPPPSD
jgi:hypothetical protein